MLNVPTVTVFSLAAIFTVIGLVQLTGPRFVRDAYRRWDYPKAVRVVTGLLDLAAAVMLAQPFLRGWGITLAALLTFGSVVTLLNHRHYGCAAMAVLLLIALIPASLALPQTSQIRFIGAHPRLLAEAP